MYSFLLYMYGKYNRKLRVYNETIMAKVDVFDLVIEIQVMQ